MVPKSQTQLHLSALLREELAGNYLAREPRRGCHLWKVTGCLLSSHLSVWLSLVIRRIGRHTHSLLYQREPDWIQTNHRTVLSRADEMVGKEKKEKITPRLSTDWWNNQRWNNTQDRERKIELDLYLTSSSCLLIIKQSGYSSVCLACLTHTYKPHMGRSIAYTSMISI